MVQFAILLIWFLTIVSGGWLLVRSAFRLSEIENLFIGIAVGVILEVVLAAILCRWIPVPIGFFVCAAIVLLAGIVVTWKTKTNLRDVQLRPLIQLIPFFFVMVIMYNLARGMGIFDDFAHLPVVSLVAAGDIPPHFPLNRSVLYAYHLFLILLAGQMTRIGEIYVWSAMDLARSLSFVIAITLAGLWAARLTRNKMVGWLGGAFIALGGGARWLLLLLPPGFLETLSRKVTLIGSGASSGYTLAEALLTEWRIEGVGKLPIPFAYTNGIVQPGVLSFEGANGLMGFVMILVLLLTSTRWKNKIGWVITGIIWSALSLVAEADLVLILVGWGLVTLLWMVQNKSWRVPGKLWVWGWIGLGAILLSLLEGGALLDILRGCLDRTSQNYQTVGFVFSAIPTIVSSQLGVLSLLDWGTLLAAICEVGPVLLVIPLLISRVIRAFRRDAWFEAFLLTGYLLTLMSVFLQFEGSTGVRNTSRLYSFLTLALLYFIPLGWRWAVSRGNSIRITAAGIALISIISGAVLFASQLPASQKPIVAPFMADVDAKISNRYWNTFPANTMVFDPVPARSVIVFGRAMETGLTWYESTPEWKALIAAPDPSEIRKAGYDYVYLDEEAWNDPSGRFKAIASASCVKMMESEKVWPGIIRKLMDIRACK